MELRITLIGNEHEWHALYLEPVPTELPPMDIHATIPHGCGRTPLDALRRLVEGTDAADIKRLWPGERHSMKPKRANRPTMQAVVGLQPRYSGRYSHKFWDRVNSLKGKDWEAAYSMGCALQEHESRVLRYVNEKQPNAETPDRQKGKTCATMW